MDSACCERRTRREDTAPLPFLPEHIEHIRTGAEVRIIRIIRKICQGKEQPRAKVLDEKDPLLNYSADAVLGLW